MNTPDQSASASSGRIQIPLQTAVRDYRQLMRAQVLDMIIRRAEAGAPWQNIWVGPMRVHGITVEEVQSLLAQRQEGAGQVIDPDEAEKQVASEPEEACATSETESPEPAPPSTKPQGPPPLSSGPAYLPPPESAVQTPTSHAGSSFTDTVPDNEVRELLDVIGNNDISAGRFGRSRAGDQPDNCTPSPDHSHLRGLGRQKPIIPTPGTTSIPAAPGSQDGTGSQSPQGSFLPSAEQAAMQHSQQTQNVEQKSRRQALKAQQAEQAEESLLPESATGQVAGNQVPVGSQLGKTALGGARTAPCAARGTIGRSFHSASGTRWTSLKVLAAVKGHRSTCIIPPVPSSPEAAHLRSGSGQMPGPIEPPPSGKRSMFGFIKGGREICQGEFIKRLTDAARENPWQVENSGPAKQSQELDKDHRLCPRCDHKIHSRAIFCQFCHLDFSIQPGDTLPPPSLNDDYY